MQCVFRCSDQTLKESVGPESGSLIRIDTDIGLHIRMQADLAGIVLSPPVNAPSFYTRSFVLMTFYIRRVQCEGNDEIARLAIKITMGGMRDNRLLNVSVEHLGF